MPSAKLKDETKGAGFGIAYKIMRLVGERCAAHFFRDVLVMGGQDVPKTGPIIVCCTHFSTIMDVAIISAKLPHRRPIHYWAKRGLYKRQPFRWILENSGNIQVDRKTKNNQDLFAGTFRAMEAGEAIGLFPEGGSFTEHRLHSMKAGAAWAALEYAKHLVDEGADDPTRTKLLIVPASINYTDKSRFRGRALFKFGPAFSVDQYTEEFLSDDVVTPQLPSKEFPFHQLVNSHLVNSLPPTPGPSTILPGGNEGPHPESRVRLGLELGTPTKSDGPILTQAHLNGISTATTAISSSSSQKATAPLSSARTAVARLTDRIGAEIYKMTIDAPDWKTWHSIKMAREIIWSRGGDLPLENLVSISNALVAVLNAPLPEAQRANEALCLLQGLVVASATDVFTLNVLQQQFPAQAKAALPTDSAFVAIPCRAEAQAALPSAPASAAFLFSQVVFLAIRIPYVAPLAIVYMPAYAVGWGLSLRYASHEEESMASAKSLCAFVVAVLTHGLLIFVIAGLCLFTPPGWILGIAISFAIEKMHIYLLDETYDRIKLLVASFRLSSASLFGNFGQVQYAAEDRVTNIAVDIVKSMPAIQYTFIKALRAEPVGDGSIKPDSTIATGWNRPFCSQFMGATIQAHSNAQSALNELFKVLEKRESETKKQSTDETKQNVYTQCSYLRSQMAMKSSGRRRKKSKVD
ncbi:hypothetical protein CBS101457_003414 [Exobasidium rhododendri]|nr:hypothetical protein CBS101457_003414 [Exobasidium rhododendri]